MAKKKKRKHSSYHRRRVGAVHPAIANIAMDAAGILTGAVGAAFINSAVKKSMTTAPAFTGGAVAAGTGIMLPYFVRGNNFVASVGKGLIAAGGLFVLNETVLSIPGVSGLPVMPGLPNSQAGFVRNAVGRTPRRRMGNLDSLKVVGQLTDN